jgi:hypothetical protein
MHIKNFTLSSLPYLVGVASFVVAAHEAAPAFRFENTRTESTHISDQIGNRSAKGDRLPIKQSAPLANDKVPTPITPNPEIKNEVGGPIRVG